MIHLQCTKEVNISKLLKTRINYLIIFQIQDNQQQQPQLILISNGSGDGKTPNYIHYQQPPSGENFMVQPHFVAAQDLQQLTPLLVQQTPQTPIMFFSNHGNQPKLISQMDTKLISVQENNNQVILV